MFDYAVKPATEDMVVATGDSNSASSGESASVTTLMINTGVIRGFVTAFATRLAMRGVPQEEITEKIGALINQCYHAGDLDPEATRWLKDEDWYARAARASSYRCPADSESMWAYAFDISEDAFCKRVYSSQWGKEYRKNLPENERAILDNYEKAASAYYEAQRIRDDYFRNKSRKGVRDMIIKYGDSLSKLDQELYQFLCQRYEISTQNDTEIEVSADKQTDPLNKGTSGNDPVEAV